jgi:ABC-type Fe3+-siderophore transport system permease subunit
MTQKVKEKLQMNTGMNVLTTTIGVLSFAHGVFWGVLRFIRPHTFNKGYSLAQRLGFRSSAVYFACFVLVPLVVGAVLLTAGMTGFSLSDAVQ